jgi:hypothetical protein
VVHQWIGSVPPLGDIWHVDFCERRNLVWVTEHVEVGANKIHAELCPHRLPDECRDVEAHSGDPLSDRAAWPDLEAKPITDVACCRLTKICLGGVHALGSVDIDVNGCPDAEVPRQQRNGALHDPPVVHQIEALEQTVISKLAL